MVSPYQNQHDFLDQDYLRMLPFDTYSQVGILWWEEWEWPEYVYMRFT